MKEISTRIITPMEAAVIRNTLHKAPLGVVPQSMFQEIDSLSVVGICNCGCHSIYFRSPSNNDYRVADGVGYLPNGERTDIIIWASLGKIAALELVNHIGEGQLPIAETVCSWEEAGESEARK